MAKFKKGKSGNPKGRPKGAANKATLLGREFCRAIVDDPQYRKKLKARALAGRLHPSVENMLWDRGYGKVKDVLQVQELPPVMVIDELTDDDVARELAERDDDA